MDNKIEKILTNENINDSINENLKILLDLIPEIKYMINFKHNHPHHHLDVWNHTLYALSLSPNDFEIRLILLLHDIGKPHSYQDEDGIRHFKGHAEISSDMARSILKRLNYKDEFINEVCLLISLHDTQINVSDIQNNEELYYKLYQVQYCDALAHNPTKLDTRIKYLKKTKEFFK